MFTPLLFFFYIYKRAMSSGEIALKNNHYYYYYYVLCFGTSLVKAGFDGAMFFMCERKVSNLIYFLLSTVVDNTKFQNNDPLQPDDC